MKSVKSIIELALTILLVVLVALGVAKVKHCAKEKTTNTQVIPTEKIVQIVHDTTTIIKYKNKIEYKKDIVTINSLRDLINALKKDTSKNSQASLKLIEELKMLKERAEKDKAALTSLIKTNSSLSIELKETKAKQLLNKTYTALNENGNYYKAYQSFNLKDTTFGLQLKINDSYSISEYTKDKKRYFKISNTNPYINIKSQHDFEIVEPKANQHRLGVGLTAGYGVVVNTRTSQHKINHGPGIMLGLNYRIF